MPIVKTSGKNFDSIVNSAPTVLAVFSASWCAPCKALTPRVEELAKSTGLVVAKIDVDESSELAAQFSVRSVPTLIVFKGGKASKTEVGNIVSEKLKALVA